MKVGPVTVAIEGVGPRGKFVLALVAFDIVVGAFLGIVLLVDESAPIASSIVEAPIAQVPSDVGGRDGAAVAFAGLLVAAFGVGVGAYFARRNSSVTIEAIRLGHDLAREAEEGRLRKLGQIAVAAVVMELVRVRYAMSEPAQNFEVTPPPFALPQFQLHRRDLAGVISFDAITEFEFLSSSDGQSQQIWNLIGDLAKAGDQTIETHLKNAFSAHLERVDRLLNRLGSVYEKAHLE